MSPYTYAANNPIFYVDPNGEENIPALRWAYANLVGKPANSHNANSWYANSWETQPRWTYTEDFDYGVCYESCWQSYMGATSNVNKELLQTGFTNKNDAFYGRTIGEKWFEEGGEGKKLVTNPENGELGDIVFLGEGGNYEGHAMLISGLPEFEIITDDNGNEFEIVTMGVITASSSKKKFIETNVTFTKQKDGTWEAWGLTLQGIGQLNISSNDEEVSVPVSKNAPVF